MGDAYVVEEHLVELGFAGYLVEGPNVHTGRLHVQEEVGHALVLGLGRVGSGHQHPPLGHMSQSGPHLLAVDHPLVAVADRPGRQAGHVRAGTRLAEQLAPDLFARVHRPQQALLLLLGGVGEHYRSPHADTDRVDS